MYPYWVLAMDLEVAAKVPHQGYSSTKLTLANLTFEPQRLRSSQRYQKMQLIVPNDTVYCRVSNSLPFMRYDHNSVLFQVPRPLNHLGNLNF